MTVRGWIGRLTLRALLLGGLVALAPAAWAEVHYDLTLQIDPAARSLQGTAVVRPDRDGRSTLRLARELTVESLRIGGQPAEFRRDGDILLPAASFGPDRPLEVSYRGVLSAPARENGPFPQSMLIDGEGSFLPDNAGWYPTLGQEIAGFALDLTVAGGQKIIAPGRILSEEQDGARYRVRLEAAHPIDGIAVFAGPYAVSERMAGTIRLRTYFHEELAGKAETYLTNVDRYLQRYSDRIGAYPFSAFHVVSSPLPVGLGYPYLTYIGRRVLQLPFIVYTSLPHEVLHSWWGNGVFIDYDSGNWAEGLTTYMADYALAGVRGPQAQRDMRARWLADYAALPAGRDAALTAFRARTHGAAQVIGYHKAAMLFHMLEQRIGKAAFDEGLRGFWEQQRFRAAAWPDLRKAFEQSSGQDLSEFFAQWLERTGAPQLTLDEAVVEPRGEGYSVRLRFGQNEPAYDLAVPVRIETAEGRSLKTVPLRQAEATVVLESKARPTALSLDPDFDMFRSLPPGDAPALLREVMLAESVALEIEPGNADFTAAARQLAERLAEGSLHGPDTGQGPRLLIGRPDWIAARATGSLARPSTDGRGQTGTADVWVRRDATGRLAAMVAARDAASLSALMRPLPHYGSKSYLTFEGRRALVHGIWDEPPRSTTIRFE